jgi:rhodanese-related sulfurtransferase
LSRILLWWRNRDKSQRALAALDDEEARCLSEAGQRIRREVLACNRAAETIRLTQPANRIFIRPWGSAISPRGDMPKHRVPSTGGRFSMSAVNKISPEKLSRLIGTPKSPALIDVRTDEDFAANPKLVPGSVRRPFAEVTAWAAEFSGKSAVAICDKGLKLSEGAAAWLRQEGIPAEILDGGIQGWKKAALPLADPSKLPPRDAKGRTVWVTRSRPKIDRIACPWLIRRFLDPNAAFLFVTPAEVKAVASKFGGVPFDIEDTFWSHRGELCTFDVLIEEFGIATGPLLHLAKIVRGADTGRLDLAPEAAGLLAASLGLSRMYADDLEQLEAGMGLYDAFYRWCRDATEETHGWTSHKASV